MKPFSAILSSLITLLTATTALAVNAPTSKPIMKCGAYTISQGNRAFQVSGSITFVDRANFYVLTDSEGNTFNLRFSAGQVVGVDISELSGEIEVPFKDLSGKLDGIKDVATAEIILNEGRLDIRDSITKELSSFACTSAN